MLSFTSANGQILRHAATQQKYRRNLQRNLPKGLAKPRGFHVRRPCLDGRAGPIVITSSQTNPSLTSASTTPIPGNQGENELQFRFGKGLGTGADL
jgi:hypothetical protein